MKRLLVELGNIGDAYIYTRHNIGFLVLDYLVKQQNIVFKPDRLAHMAYSSCSGHQVYMIKPVTYMNNSGQSIKYWLQKLSIPMDQSLTIVDDITLPFSHMRLCTKGSDGGHNGLKSIASWLESDAYPRLRIGIGSDFPRGKLADFLLGNFLPKEQEELPFLLDRASEILMSWRMVYTMNNNPLNK